jgi:enoyl-CoA hydratase/carnithine racemase
LSLVITEDRGVVRHVVLNRPEKRNAFNTELIFATGEALRAAANDISVRAVVIRGEGPVFSAGMDIKELASLTDSPGRLREFRRISIEAWNIAEEMTKPTIAQVHGVAVGGAFELSLACDFRVVADDARMSVPEVQLGLVPDVGGLSRLPAIVGLGRAKEFVLTGREFDAEEAFRVGYANRIAPSDQLDAATLEFTDQLTSGFAVPIGLSKRVLDAAAKPGLAQTLEMEVIAQEVAAASLAAARKDAQAATGE